MLRQDTQNDVHQQSNVRCKKAITAAFVKHIFVVVNQWPGFTALEHGQQSEPAVTEDYMSAMQRSAILAWKV